MDEKTQALRERLIDFSLRCLKLFRALPRCQEARVYGVQLLRSSSSVGANHREACRSRSTAEFVAKLGDCLKELDETCYWLEVIRRADLVDEHRMRLIEQEANDLTGLFVSIVKSAKSPQSRVFETVPSPESEL